MVFLIIATIVNFFLVVKVATGGLRTFLLYTLGILSVLTFGGLTRGFFWTAILTAGVLILANLLNGKNKDEDLAGPSKYDDHYQELIRFISFAKKVAPMMGGNSGITIRYDAPDGDSYVKDVTASLGFYDFDEIRFAREFAMSGDPHKMAHFYYRSISERAGLTDQDWPFAIDAYDFSDMLRGEHRFLTLIPDTHPDVFTLEVRGGFDSRNAGQVHSTVMRLLKTHFPELQIVRNHSTPYSMSISVKL